MAQRLVRARRKIAGAAIPYRVPADHELPDRLPAVLAVVYLVFTEGHTATSGDALVRVDLCEEAVRLARLLAELLPDESEVHGLLGLLLVTDARRATRLDADGDLVLLADQDRSAWDRDRIDEGHAHIELAPAARRRRPGPLRAAGRHRRGARAVPVLDGHRLGRDRRPLRPARRGPPDPGRAAEPRRRRGGAGRRRRPAWPRSTPSTSSPPSTSGTPAGPSCCAGWTVTTRPPAPTKPPWRAGRTTRSGASSSVGWLTSPRRHLARIVSSRPKSARQRDGRRRRHVDRVDPGRHGDPHRAVDGRQRRAREPRSLGADDEGEPRREGPR